MLIYVFYIVGTLVISLLLSILAYLWWSEYINRRGKEKTFRIVYNNAHRGATLWRNTHPSFWKYHKMKRGSVIVVPSNPWIEVNQKDAGSATFLHELGHLMMDIAWLTLEGHVYHNMVRVTSEDLVMEATFEFMAWGIATRLGKINSEWLMKLMIRLYKNLCGEVKVRTALMIAVATPLDKHSIVSSTRRILKVMNM